MAQIVTAASRPRQNGSKYAIVKYCLFVIIFFGSAGVWYSAQNDFNRYVYNLDDTGDTIQSPQLRVQQYGRLGIPQDKAVALPSIRIDSEKAKKTIYGGEGDKQHLGGFTDFDVMGLSPSVWKDMIEYMGVKSIIDVGCGRGTSTSWFVLHGLDTACVEGSHDGIEKSMVPNKENVYTEHDFSRGPWWPEKTYDAAWSVEFLEHVGRNFQQNYIPVFQKAAIIIATSSTWGGWHHVEVHEDPWWIYRMQSFGLVYSKDLTERVRKTASKESSRKEEAPNGDTFNAQHIWLSAKVFINPAVASLPEHQHLFSEHGCYKERIKGAKSGDPRWITRPCSTKHKETELPDEYLPLMLTEEMDKNWMELVKRNIASKKD